jgi:UPF0716 family protein affecting phage T7 exclusion
MRFVMLAIVLIFPLVDLFVTARFARWSGVLLLVPGLLSDVLAVLLLMLPINQRGGFGPQPVTAGRSRTLDGDYRRLE